MLALVVPAGLLALAGWWWSARMAGDMTGMGGMGATMSFGAFALAWAAMMAAMMLPAVLPVVKLYARAAEKGRAAPVGFFVAGYLALWTVLVLGGYLAWRTLEGAARRGPGLGRSAWPGATATEPAIAWRLTGRGYEFCNCQPGCTCNFSGFPTSSDGSCKAAVAKRTAAVKDSSGWSPGVRVPSLVSGDDWSITRSQRG